MNTIAKIASPESTTGMALTNRIAGRTVGLLLGAGGVRGCAHAGVFSILEAAGISADVVVGASIGSMFGAAYAADWPVDRIRRLTDFAPKRAVAEFYLNRLRIDDETYIGALLSELGRDTLIQDLPRKFACLAVERSSGQTFAITRGPLLKAIEASIALPGVARPVTIANRTFIDGGLKGPVPAGIARAKGAEFIVRVELLGAQRVRSRIRKLVRAQPAEYVRPRQANPTGPADLGNDEVISVTCDSEDDLRISPTFFGLFCNAPLGVRFSAKRGRIAAVRALALQ